MNTHVHFRTPSTLSGRTDQTMQQKLPSSDCVSKVEKAHKAQERDTSRIFLFSSCGMDRADGASTPLPTPASDSCHHDSSRDSVFPLAVPPSPSAQDAFRILADAVSDPSQAFHPVVAVAAWCKLKSLRGQPVSDQRLERLGVEVDTLDRETIERASREHRVRNRARAHAAQRGFQGPAPLIVPDAIA